MNRHEERIENLMYTCYLDKRHYAAIEAAKLEHGGINYIEELFGCNRKTIATSLEELKNDIVPTPRIRREGGGSNDAGKIRENIDEVFLFVIAEYIAGDPIDEELR